MIDDLPNTRAKAKAQGVKYYCTGKPCKWGHISVRSVSSKACHACVRERARHWRANNTERQRENERRRHAKNRKTRIEYSRQYYAKNRAYFREKGRRHREENREHYREYRRLYNTENRKRLREYGRRHYIENRDRYAAQTAKREADKIQRTPAWADESIIAGLYWAARQISEQTGIQMHVDHILPLRGREVSGLHCEDNLQLLPADANFSKGNHLVEDWLE